VWRDICHVLARRWPLARVLLVACHVQGEPAPASIVTAFRRLERYIEERHAAGRSDEAPTVTILARGGGSLEDLWAFNDERVVRAVVAHTVPVVCGVGHEVDVTLADFAADVRAPTPSAAAEVVVPDRSELTASLRRAADRLAGASSRRVAVARRDLAAEQRALAQVGPAARLAASREQVGLLFDRATRALTARLARDRLVLTRDRELLPRLGQSRVAAARARLDSAATALAVLGPQATLDRGYAIARRRDSGAIVRTPAEAPAGTSLRLTVARGELDATVEEGSGG
jgi:exodeoxyribonuclease VII large subunit